MVHQKFFSTFDENFDTLAHRAGLKNLTEWILVITGFAANYRWTAIEMKIRALTGGSLADVVPIELDRVVHDRGKLTDYQVDVGNFYTVIFLCSLVRDGQDAFGDSQFMHQVIIM